MQKTQTIIGLVALAILLLGGTYIITKKDTTGYTAKDNYTYPTDSTTKTPTTPTTKPVTKPGTTPIPSTYTITEVATHNSSASCWSVVNTGVYDLTSWINSHPGGKEAIKSMCGLDASAEFNDQHGGQGKPEKVLISFKIGTVK